MIEIELKHTDYIYKSKHLQIKNEKIIIDEHLIAKIASRGFGVLGTALLAFCPPPAAAFDEIHRLHTLEI